MNFSDFCVESFFTILITGHLFCAIYYTYLFIALIKFKIMVSLCTSYFVNFRENTSYNI